MEVELTDKHEIVLPDEMCEELGLEPGQRFVVRARNKFLITLVPIRPMKELRGIFKGMSIDGYREDEDRI